MTVSSLRGMISQKVRPSNKLFGNVSWTTVPILNILKNVVDVVNGSKISL